MTGWAAGGLWHKGWKLVTMHLSKAAVGKIGKIPIEMRDGDFDHDDWSCTILRMISPRRTIWPASTPTR
jgi:hypothetical protein